MIDIIEKHAKKIFDYLSKKTKHYANISHIAIVRYQNANADHSLAVIENDHVYGYVGAFNNSWIEFIDVKINGNEKCKYQIIIDKILKLCKQYDIAIPYNLHRQPIVIVKKGTTLHQLLIEADLAA